VLVMALLSFADSHPEPSGSRWATPPSLIQQRPGHSLERLNKLCYKLAKKQPEGDLTEIH
jgi:hypothetical protein